MNALHVHRVGSILDAALYYATALGFPVFPCKPDKSPFIAGGFKAASSDEAQIRAWWTQFTDAMIGVPTGPNSGVWVTDIDVDEGKGIDGFPLWHQLIAQYGEISPTLTSITPRGGRHFSSPGKQA